MDRQRQRAPLDHDFHAVAVAQATPGRGKECRQQGSDGQQKPGPACYLGISFDAQLLDVQWQEGHDKGKACKNHGGSDVECESIASPLLSGNKGRIERRLMRSNILTSSASCKKPDAEMPHVHSALRPPTKQKPPPSHQGTKTQRHNKFLFINCCVFVPLCLGGE